MRWTALALALLASPAAAQVNQQSLCANCVVGRLGIGPGPTQAIPFATLSAQLTGASITLNSGNGQTAPGLMTGGGTYSFGATTDTPRMTGLGLGGVAPATGLKLYNAAVLPGAGGQSAVGADSTNGGVLLGQGSLYDASIQNKSGSVALGVPTGTQSLVLPNPATVGTVGGSLCATSAGLILYESGVNCFAVSGVVIASGKTLTVNNTLTFNGTDGTTFTYPGSSDTVDTLGANQTVTGNKTFSGTLNITGTGQINGTAFGTFATANSATPPAIGGTTPAAGSFTTLTASTPVGLSSGGTNAGTAAGARASGGLNIDEFTAHGDSTYNILSTDRVVGTSATFTAARTWTLPAASTVNAGQLLIVADFAGGVTGANTLTVQRAGSDTVNGSTSITISTSNGSYAFIADGISKWTAQALGAAATVGVSSVNGQTGSVNVVAGAGTSVNTAGGNITVANTGVTSVNTSTGAVTVVQPPQGRLTLQTGHPVMTTSQTSQSTLYYDCYRGNQILYYTGTADAVDTISSCEVSTAMVSAASAGQVVSGQVYDAWWVHSGANRICLAMSASSGGGGGWASDTGGSTTARGTGYSQLDFTTRPYITNKNAITNCFNGATNYGSVSANQASYLGTIYASANGQTSFTFGSSAGGGGAANLYVWNAYNRVEVDTTVTDSTASWTYGTASARSSDNSTSNRVSFVIGNAEDSIFARFEQEISGAANSIKPGVGLAIDSTSAFDKEAIWNNPSTTFASAVTIGISNTYNNQLGQHFIQALEIGDGSTTTTFLGAAFYALSAQLRM